VARVPLGATDAVAAAGTDDEEVNINSTKGIGLVDKISRVDIVLDAIPSSNDTKMLTSLSLNASAGTYVADRHDVLACNPP
jgi:hypothetical protein